jgi:hypothetical protein
MISFARISEIGQACEQAVDRHARLFGGEFFLVKT